MTVEQIIGWFLALLCIVIVCVGAAAAVAFWVDKDPTLTPPARVIGSGLSVAFVLAGLLGLKALS